MKYIEVNRNKVKAIQSDWRETSALLREKVMNLPYILENPHKEPKALEWLECISKIHPQKLRRARA